MFTLRPEQIKALNAPFEDRFVEGMIRRLQQAFPEKLEGLEAAVLRSRLRGLIARAEAYEIRREADVAVFIELEVEHGPRFEEQPDWAWARELLEHRGLAGQTKVDLIRQRLLEQ